MKKIVKKLVAVASAVLMLTSTLPVLAGQSADALEAGTAYLNINNADWADFEAEYTNAVITGDGSYTVKMVAAEAQNLAQFNALEVKDGEATLGTGSIITIDSIKINDEEIALQGDSYTCSADGAGTTTRVNLYNEWNAPDETATAGDDKHLDHRTAAADLMACTAVLWDSSYLTAGITSIEVNFTVSNFGASAEAAAPVEAPTVEGPAIAHLAINNADWAEFEATYVDAEITGNGTYTVSMTAAEAQNLAQFNALQVENGEYLLGTACILTVDEIKINGEVIELQGDSYTCSADGGGATTRVNLYNEWNAPDETATAGDDNHADHRTAAADLMACTAMLWDASYLTAGVTSIEVTFTVSNYGVGAQGGEAAAPSVTLDKNGVYNAYMCFQTPSYSFRNGWNDEKYGKSTDFFMTVTGWDADNNAVTLPGSFADAKIEGNGTYTVSATGLEFAADDFANEAPMNLIFVSTDIPRSDDITISDIVLKVNGKKTDLADCGALISPEDNDEYITIMIQNSWNADIKTLGYYAVPVTSLEVTFTVSGFDYDQAGAAVEAPEETKTDAPAATTETKDEKKDGKNSNKTVIIIIVIVAVLVCAAVVAAVMSSKKKK